MSIAEALESCRSSLRALERETALATEEETSFTGVVALDGALPVGAGPLAHRAAASRARARRWRISPKPSTVTAIQATVATAIALPVAYALSGLKDAESHLLPPFSIHGNGRAARRYRRAKALTSILRSATGEVHHLAYDASVSGQVNTSNVEALRRSVGTSRGSSATPSNPTAQPRHVTSRWACQPPATTAQAPSRTASSRRWTGSRARSPFSPSA